MLHLGNTEEHECHRHGFDRDFLSDGRHILLKIIDGIRVLISFHLINETSIRSAFAGATPYHLKTKSPPTLYTCHHSEDRQQFVPLGALLLQNIIALGHKREQISLIRIIQVVVSDIQLIIEAKISLIYSSLCTRQ